ncbi:DUF6710 family protein [Streptococcus uberis]|uniref:DUF6710 family protein n=1 Tax=Streptococcus uberis TaxID=1349 RepID=UPI0020BFBFBE|nr:DUF6710 family protein [Streptococcus uberis]
MKIIAEIKSIVKEGKTLRVIETEKENKKKEENERYENRNKRLIEEAENKQKILNQNLDYVKIFLRSKDYEGLNKFLRLLTLTHSYRVAEINLNSIDESPLQINNCFNLFEEIYSILQSNNIDVEVRSLHFDVHKDDAKIIEKFNCTPVFEKKPDFSIIDRPILLNPWHKNRIIHNLTNINKQNPLVPHSNEINWYFYPLDILLCNGGNHSQLSALLSNDINQKSQISILQDLSPLYDVIYFDGSEFKLKADNSKIMDASHYIKNQLGIFFEIGRLLKEHSLYFPEYINKWIR